MKDLFDEMLLTDISSKDLYGEVWEKLNVKYLSDATDDLNEINGKIYGSKDRFIGLMTINIDDKIKNAFFVVDTESPVTCISQEMFDKFNINIIGRKLMVRLNGRRHKANCSPVNSIFRDLNLLGTDFLNDNEARLTGNFKQKTFNIKLGKPWKGSK